MLNPIIWLIAAIVVMILLRVFFKGIFKIISTIMFILSIAGMILGYFVYRDVNELRQSWPDSDKLVLLTNDKVYAGMITKWGIINSHFRIKIMIFF